MYNLFDAENHLDYTLFGRVQGLKCWFPVNEPNTESCMHTYC